MAFVMRGESVMALLRSHRGSTAPSPTCEGALPIPRGAGVRRDGARVHRDDAHVRRDGAATCFLAGHHGTDPSSRRRHERGPIPPCDSRYPTRRSSRSADTSLRSARVQKLPPRPAPSRTSRPSSRAASLRGRRSDVRFDDDLFEPRAPRVCSAPGRPAKRCRRGSLRPRRTRR